MESDHQTDTNGQENTGTVGVPEASNFPRGCIIPYHAGTTTVEDAVQCGGSDVQIGQGNADKTSASDVDLQNLAGDQKTFRGEDTENIYKCSGGEFPQPIDKASPGEGISYRKAPIYHLQQPPAAPFNKTTLNPQEGCKIQDAVIDFKELNVDREQEREKSADQGVKDENVSEGRKTCIYEEDKTPNLPVDTRPLTYGTGESKTDCVNLHTNSGADERNLAGDRDTIRELENNCSKREFLAQQLVRSSSADDLKEAVPIYQTFTCHSSFETGESAGSLYGSSGDDNEGGEEGNRRSSGEFLRQLGKSTSKDHPKGKAPTDLETGESSDICRLEEEEEVVEEVEGLSVGLDPVLRSTMDGLQYAALAKAMVDVKVWDSIALEIEIPHCLHNPSCSVIWTPPNPKNGCTLKDAVDEFKEVYEKNQQVCKLNEGNNTSLENQTRQESGNEGNNSNLEDSVNFEEEALDQSTAASEGGLMHEIDEEGLMNGADEDDLAAWIWMNLIYPTDGLEGWRRSMNLCPSDEESPNMLHVMSTVLNYNSDETGAGVIRSQQDNAEAVEDHDSMSDSNDVQGKLESGDNTVNENNGGAYTLYSNQERGTSARFRSDEREPRSASEGTISSIGHDNSTDPDDLWTPYLK